jgi:hypothetical protein
VPATEAINQSLESDVISYSEPPQIRTYYEDSSDDEASAPRGEGILDTGEEAPDCDVEEASRLETDSV